jgi:hypothetical protein
MNPVTTMASVRPTLRRWAGLLIVAPSATAIVGATTVWALTSVPQPPATPVHQTAASQRGQARALAVPILISPVRSPQSTAPSHDALALALVSRQQELAMLQRRLAALSAQLNATVPNHPSSPRPVLKTAAGNSVTLASSPTKD